MTELFAMQSSDSFGRLIPWLMLLFIYTGCESTLLTCCWLPLVVPNLTSASSLETVAMMFGVRHHIDPLCLIVYFNPLIATLKPQSNGPSQQYSDWYTGR